MKLIFFLVAFCLISIRVYFSWAGKDREKKGVSSADMVIKSDNFYEAIKYSGKFQFSDDEKEFKSISPGGYLEFRLNDEKLKAESNLQGQIEYSLFDGKDNLNPDEEAGKSFVARAIHEMLAWGFDADARMDRLYRKGGSRALLNEIDSMRTDPVKMIYIDRLFTIDSLSSEDLLVLMDKISTLGADMDKGRFLSRLSATQLKDPQIDTAFFRVVESMGADMDKVNMMQHILDQDSVSSENVFRILDIGGRLGNDMDKSNLFGQLIDKGLISGAGFDTLLVFTDRMGADMDKINLYRKLMDGKSITESQWASLINQAAKLGSDMDKSTLLIEIAQKMPRTEMLKSLYLTAAKSISNDSDYGKAVRAVE
jgi:hypothetical protein